MSQGSAREVAVCLCVCCSIHRHYHRTQGRSPINSDTNTFCLFSPPPHLTLTILFYFFIFIFFKEIFRSLFHYNSVTHLKLKLLNLPPPPPSHFVNVLIHIFIVYVNIFFYQTHCQKHSGFNRFNEICLYYQQCDKKNNTLHLI